MKLRTYLRNCLLLKVGFVFVVTLSGATLELDLNQAVASMLQQNHRVRMQLVETHIASDAIDAALGEFDAYFFFEAGWDVVNRDQNSLEFVNTGALIEQRYWEDDVIRGRSGIGAKSSLGTKYELSLSMMQTTNTVSRNNPTSIFDPEYESFAGLTVTQPLLRGFGKKVNRAMVTVAELELGVSYFEQEIVVTNQLVELINAFHDILYGQENLRVKMDAKFLAETLLAENRRRVELGRMSQQDITQAMVQVSQAEEELILAEDFLRDRKTALARIIYGRPADDVFNFRVRGDLALDAVPQYNTEALRATAHQHRPDFLLAQALQNQEEVRLHYARNQLLPELDMKFSYGLTGLADNERNSFTRMRDLDTTQWSVGVVLKVPFVNRRARAEASAANRRTQLAEMEVGRVEQQIYLDIRNAIERVSAQQRRLATAQRSVELAEESLKVENRMLEEGRSTSFQVMKAQDVLSDARTRELAALVDLKKATVEVDVVSGRLLSQYGLNLRSEYDHLRGKSRRILRWGWSKNS